MKFVGFKQQCAQPIANEGEYNCVIFDDRYTHANLFHLLQRYAADVPKEKIMLLEAINAGSMRQNGSEFIDYSSSLSMRLGSGDPRNTEYFNHSVCSGKTLKFIMLSNFNFLVFPKFIFEPEDVEDLDTCGFLMGEFNCLPMGEGEMKAENPTVVHLAPTWIFNELDAIDRLSHLLNQDC